MNALYSFYDHRATENDWPGSHVYMHTGGEPFHAAAWIKASLDFAWTLPRFDAADFASAFIAANRDSGGSVLVTNGTAWRDTLTCPIKYRYEVWPQDRSLMIAAYRVHGCTDLSKKNWIYDTLMGAGPLNAFEDCFGKTVFPAS